jgi:hypothetical protein
MDGHRGRGDERGIAASLYARHATNFMFTFFLTWPSLTQRAAIIHSY